MYIVLFSGWSTPPKCDKLENRRICWSLFFVLALVTKIEKYFKVTLGLDLNYISPETSIYFIVFVLLRCILNICITFCFKVQCNTYDIKVVLFEVSS